MTELLDSIPNDLPACQKRLRAALEQLRDLERQLDEFVATTEELHERIALACHYTSIFSAFHSREVDVHERASEVGRVPAYPELRLDRHA